MADLPRVPPAAPVADPNGPANAAPPPMGRLTRGEWIALILVLVLIVLICVFHNWLGIPLDFQTSAVFIGAATVLYAANKRFFAKGPSSNDTIRFVIAFDSLAFVVVGLAATVLACKNWQTALLTAGSCLLIGGFFGLLFGYPQGVAQQSSQPKQGPVANAGVGAQGQQQIPAQNNPAPDNHGKNLLADSASTLGKVITGFTLAKLHSASTYYEGLCRGVGPALGAADASNSHILAGAIIAYFLATGFLSGLFLPTYFMSDHF